MAFDDETMALTLLNNITTESDHFWITLDHQKKRLYATSETSWSSYVIEDSKSLRRDKSLNFQGNCSGSQPIFVEGSSLFPYTVYGVTYGGNKSCGNVLSVDESGSLSQIIQAFDYGPSSGVHGLALGPGSEVLYSADDSGNAIWTHTVNPKNGQLQYLDRIVAPTSGSDPRHIAVHPKGKFAYVIFEGTNRLALYKIDPDTKRLAYSKSFSLLPNGYPTSKYMADEVALSYSASYIWATTRSTRSNHTGYISAFEASSDGDILSQLFLDPTTTSGAMSNAVAPSTFSDNFVALTDSEKGFVQIWKFVNGSTEVVATLNLQDGGCCANAVWLD
ncbi:hypothetical protein N7494_005486 [Penicillium frequentans]|uniref:Carboxy-cis,cis-muconate cyclase n=1 Tax=Penicillium frequentans TaxID=3151616 RepID=A0AAD6CUD8_9EURO|nr:hypothetical protein N7494_005486 [Penicillium glabrum]